MKTFLLVLCVFSVSVALSQTNTTPFPYTIQHTIHPIGQIVFDSGWCNEQYNALILDFLNYKKVKMLVSDNNIKGNAAVFVIDGFEQSSCQYTTVRYYNGIMEDITDKYIFWQIKPREK